MKKYEAYKNSGVEWIGEIPEGWSTSKLKFEVDMVLGKMLEDKEPKNNDGSYTMEPYLKSRNIGMLEVYNNIEQVDKMWFNDKEKALYELQEGDLVMNEGGDIGKVSLWKDSGYKCYIQNSVHKLTPHFDTLDSSYLQFMIFHVTTKGYFNTVVSSISIAHLTKEKLAETPILLPPLSEQRAIASYLDHKVGLIDASVSAINTQIEDLKAYRQSVISEAVTKGLNPNAPMKDSGIEWIGEIPEKWTVVPLKHYLSLKGRIGWNGLKSDEFEEESYAYLVTGQDFDSAEVDWSKCYQINKERYDEDPFIQLDNGDLLVTKDGTIGKIAKVVNLDKPACLNSGIFVVKQTKGLFEQSYLYWTFVSNQLKEFVGFNSTGSTIQHLYQNVFENMPLALPPLSEQQAIASYLDTKTAKIDSTIKSLEAQRDDLNALKQSIISEAVTGKIDVRDWDSNNEQ